jgi:integrase
MWFYLEKELAGNRWKENNLIFPTPIGTSIDPRNLLNDFRRVLERAGLLQMRFHDLRHTSITLILNEIGAPIKRHSVGQGIPDHPQQLIFIEEKRPPNWMKLLPKAWTI